MLACLSVCLPGASVTRVFAKSLDIVRVLYNYKNKLEQDDQGAQVKKRHSSMQHGRSNNKGAKNRSVSQSAGMTC